MRMFPSFEIKDAVIQKIKDLHAEGRMCSFSVSMVHPGDQETSYCFIGAVGEFFGEGRINGFSLLWSWGWNQGREVWDAINLNNAEGEIQSIASRLVSVDKLLNYLNETEVGHHCES